MAVIWKNKSELEWLQELKKEIERLGLQNDPSRTEYQKLYDSNRLPSPNSYLKNIGKTWPEIMKMIGYEYSGNVGRSKKNVDGIGRPKGNGKGIPVAEWNKFSEQELLEKVGETIYRNGIITKESYAEKKEKMLPSYGTLIAKYGSWRQVKAQALKAFKNKGE